MRDGDQEEQEARDGADAERAVREAHDRHGYRRAQDAPQPAPSEGQAQERPALLRMRSVRHHNLIYGWGFVLGN